MFTPKQLKTIKKVITDDELHTAGKKDSKAFSQTLLLATERLQEIYLNTCVQDELSPRFNKEKNSKGRQDDKENRHFVRRLNSRRRNSKSLEKYAKNLPQKKNGAKPKKEKLSKSEKSNFLNQITDLVNENLTLKTKLETSIDKDMLHKKQRNLKKKTIDKLKDLENDVKKHRIIEETWMKCKESLLEQNKILVDELNRVQKKKKHHKNGNSKSRSRNRLRYSSRSKSRSLETKSRHTKSMMTGFDGRKGSKNSLLSNKWSIGDNYNSTNVRSKSRDETQDLNNHPIQKQNPEICIVEEDAESVDRKKMTNTRKEEYLNTFGKKQESKEDDLYNYEYSKSKDDTPDFDTFDHNAVQSIQKTQNRDLLNRDMVILGYQTKCEQLEIVRT